MAKCADGRARLFLGGVFIAVAMAPASWIASDALERDNDFCNACHLSDGVPLHVGIRRDFDAVPAETLASAHAEVGFDQREFRCIDCHGGVGLMGRSRVKMLALRDAVVWAVGSYEEPSVMAHPLRDADCRQCHERYQPSAGSTESAFHEIAEHNVDLSVRCVECHLVHVRGGDPGFDFLHGASVRRQCARCHPQYEEGIQ